MIPKTLCFLYLLVISICDIATLKIPNFITAITFVVIFVLDIIYFPKNIPMNLLCACLFFLLFFIILFITKGLGYGDLKVAALIGYCTGFFKTLAIFIYASMLGMLFFIFVKIYWKNKIKKIPFAPFIAAGYVISEISLWGIL